jgi:tRNA A37 threonylcarbamoyltransferase TsaD
LAVGLNAAKSIAKLHRLPLVSVNHLEAHLLVPRIADKSLQFPFLTLLVSGGHSQLLLARGVDQYTLSQKKTSYDFPPTLFSFSSASFKI